MKKIELFVLLLVAVAVVGMNIGIKDYMSGKTEAPHLVSAEEETVAEDENKFIAAANEVINAIIPTPEPLNVLLVGLDKSKALADINIVVHLDTETNKLKLISLPRDLFIDFSDEKFRAIKAGNPKININYCKLTEVYSNAGHKEQALQDMKAVASGITGLDIDYVAAIDTNGFVDIVDILGGVDFYVPQNMDYEDPYQDLYIHLKEGQQHLDGDEAEQLVRFRKYGGNVAPDKQRMKVQQDFLKELSKKVLGINSFGQVKDLITKGYEMLKTDIGILTILEYAEYTLSQDISELLSSGDMIIIPSSGERMGELNLWYENWDQDEAELIVNQLLKD